VIDSIRTESRPLKGLKAETVEASDLARFPFMTGWFEPLLLLKLLWRVIVSDLFGQYADRRLIQAALDAVPNEKHVERAKLADIEPDKEGAIWIDYVSDLGDGFDATYAIACLLAQPHLDIGNVRLPRGSVLILGGDEVYPTAKRDDYTVKMRLPYEFALPDSEEAKKIPMLVLPGNHDWYDGLVNFLAIFCREKATRIGRWRTNQRRSYFAAQIIHNWWVWGIDIALVRDMDQPQADYFVAIAEAMPKGANIVLCSAEPGWYTAEEGDSYRTLSYAAWIAENAGRDTGGRDLKIPLVLSGDSHHYARYSGSGAQYITSGGGGAFLHGTQELKEAIKAKWLKEKSSDLKLEQCYPSKETSRALLDGNRNFGALNKGLTWTLAGLYLACAFVLASALRIDVGVGVFIALLGGILGYSSYQEGWSKQIVWLSILHAAAHMTVVLALAAIAILIDADEWYWLLRLLFIGLLVVVVGRWAAGHIFGFNLLLTCRNCGINNNDAFSAMKLDSHRHFLRIKIFGDTLTVYPIKLDQVPTRGQWVKNADMGAERPSVFRARPDMVPQLIEAPIEIHARHAPSTSDVKTPREMPDHH
jgi:hypothetical protein